MVMLEDISEAGYDISVYTEPKYLPQQLLDKIDNWTTYKPKYYGFDTVRLMLKCSKYQISPFILKDNYSYKTDDFSTLRKNDFTVWEVDYDYPFWNALKDTGLSISDKTSIGSFKLYHMYGAHPSFNMTEDFMPVDYLGNYEAMISQAKGSLKIVYEYLNQLKALGLYDSSEIYITADHGENYLYDSYRFVLLEKRKLINTSSPILLVKHAHSTWKGVHESKAPVSHTEMIASIINTIVPQNTAKYGQTLEDIGEMQERKRIFIFDRGDMPYVKVEINGDVLNPDNWTIVERISLEDKKRSNN